MRKEKAKTGFKKRWGFATLLLFGIGILARNRLFLDGVIDIHKEHNLTSPQVTIYNY